DSLHDTIQAIAATVEMRDPYTAGHQRRVADLAAGIAGEMGLTHEQIYAINLAGIVHDLGKISIPAEILSKPGRLSPIEYTLVKQHPQAGYDILKGIDFPWPLAQFVLQHHERLDGSGYPQGLKGEEILPEARVLAVADVIEAMASHRPYRAGLGLESALEEISTHRGTLYDSAAVDAALRLFREKNYQFKP
ncbi:MAG TPA: HD-GYP domain-containing protein, partial [Gallionella sp.]|nr:HD-GYP domain-containing protein [Gallionella sp.]